MRNVQRAPLMAQPINAQRENTIHSARPRLAGPPEKRRNVVAWSPDVTPIALPSGWRLFFGPEVFGVHKGPMESHRGGRTKLRGDHCQCAGAPHAGCGERFNSTRAFDKHRADADSSRRCLSAAEMQAKGMALNARGFWITSKRPILHSAAITEAAIGRNPWVGSAPLDDRREIAMGERETMGAGVHS